MTSNDDLAAGLLAAVHDLDFGATPDSLRGGAALAQMPSLDLAIVAFPPGAPPVWANVLISRDHPRGIVARIGPDAGSVSNVSYVADQTNHDLVSTAWLPDADWSRTRWLPLAGQGGATGAVTASADADSDAETDAQRFVVPYPASLLKLMVAVGVGIGVDAGVIAYADAWAHAGRKRKVADWCEDMITISCNDSTSAMVALLHQRRLLGADRNVLHARFGALGLHLLRINSTQPDGGWGNAAGAGVGQIHMSAWDTARLLWLLDPDAPAAPWRGAQPILSAAARDPLLGWLRDQALHEILSSTVLAGVPGFVAGMPAQLPARWIDADGAAPVGDHLFPPDVRPANAVAQVQFWHKTGTTENYASDAGIVRGIAPHRRHYIVALVTSLGSRYAPNPHCATTWRIPALGAAIDRLMARWLEPAP